MKNEIEKTEMELWSAMTELLAKMRQSKPEDRNEKARRYAVTITEFEKVMGYFNTFILEDWGDADISADK
jgi:hypothetical protein